MKPLNATDQAFMELALEQASLAARAGEIPVGAVVVKDGAVIGAGHNVSIAQSDPTGHAEVVALRNAARHLGNYRLDACTLYVTLEPCAMCAGALLHSRVGRVVFGATDPKAGACGSVVDLFANAQLNHQTSVQGGVLAEDCGTQLRSFFVALRQSQRTSAAPLRDDALRTPELRFENLPGYPWSPCYRNDLQGLSGLRLHYLDEGPPNATTTFLCLHGNPTWSYVYRKMIPVWAGSGCRVIAPDLIGFGKSDKPKRDSAHSFEFHRRYLLELVDTLDLQNVVLVVQDWGGLLGLTLPMQATHRYAGLAIMNTMLATGQFALPTGFMEWREMCAKSPQYDIARLMLRGNPHLSRAESEAYNAPFADAGHRAATRAFPRMVTEDSQSPAAQIAQAAAHFLEHQWTGKTFMAVGAKDPVFTPDHMRALAARIRGCPAPVVLEEAGHFVQEHGQLIAEACLRAFGDR